MRIGAWAGARSIGRSGRWLLLGLMLFVLAVVAVDVLVDDPLRNSIERRMNAALEGYTVHLGAVDFRPWNFSLELEELAVLQDAHPAAPVLELAELEFNVDWRALLRLRLVADAELREPRLFIHLPQLREERDDDIDVEERGWNDALEEVYPLEINELRIVDGSLTYVDEDPARPLRLSRVAVVARNLRNVRSPDRRYPSAFDASATVFTSGSAALRGRADFLADPIPDLSANLRIQKVPLDRLDPIVEDYRLSVRRGELSADGYILYGPRDRRVTLDELQIDGIHVDYVNDPALTRRAAEAVAEVDRQQQTQVLVRRLRLTDSELGFVNRAQDPGFRLFLADLEVTLDGWSNIPQADPSRLRARGSFMGSGRTAVHGVFRPHSAGADFELAIAIEGTRLAAMNDLLRAYANLDVTAGAFSFYSEMRVAGGRIDGYVKPLFHGVEAYDPQQDREQGLFRRLWERLAEGVAEILENRPREDVATVTDISGPVYDPQASNLQVTLNLIENAFFDAILPGLQARAEEDE